MGWASVRRLLFIISLCFWINGACFSGVFLAPVSHPEVISESSAPYNTRQKILYISEDTDAGRNGAKIVRRYFRNVGEIYYTNQWSPDEKERRKAVRSRIAEMSYDIIISYKSDLVLLKKELEKAGNGAINFHPSPPEHPGLGMYVYPVLHRDERNFGGVTVHEINEKIDSGRIYETLRFSIPPHFTVDQVRDSTTRHAEELLAQVMSRLAFFEKTTFLENPGLRAVSWGTHTFTHADETRMMTEYDIRRAA